jgi:hypothetical protein
MLIDCSIPPWQVRDYTRTELIALHQEARRRSDDGNQ